jgi:hypothetical protein
LLAGVKKICPALWVAAQIRPYFVIGLVWSNFRSQRRSIFPVGVMQGFRIYGRFPQ